MPVLALDHVNLRPRDPGATVAFFRDVLGMKVAPPMGREGTTDNGGWVYDEGNRPIVHIGAADRPYPTDAEHAFTPAHGSGTVHHVALNCADFDGMTTRLADSHVDFTVNDLPHFSLRQLFVADPNGILFELNFR